MNGFDSDDFTGLPTGDWRLKVTLDEHLPSTHRALYTLDRSMEEIGVQPQADLDSVHLLDGIGWQLKAHQFDLSSTYELTVAQDGVMTVSNGKLSAAAHMEEVPVFKKKSGITYADSPVSGMFALTKRVAAGGSFSQEVAGDVALLARPNTAAENVAMDRVIVSTSNHVPGDHLHLRVYIPESEMASSDGLMTIYFNAGCGSWDQWAGNGRYAVKLLGSGRAELYERGRAPGDVADRWLMVKDFSWAPAAQVFNSYHGITIAMDGREDDGDYYGRAIVFAFSGLPLGRETSSMERWISGAARGLSSARTVSYKPRQKTRTAIEQDKIRIDCRADLRPTVAMFGSTYPDDGEIYDAPLSYPLDLHGSSPLTIAWFGTKPAGTSVTITLHNAETGALISGGTPTALDHGGVVVYPVPAGIRHFRIKAVLSASTDNRKTPTIRTLRFFRDAVIETPVVTPYTLTERESSGLLSEIMTDLTVTHPGRDISGASAMLRLADFGGGLTRLQNRGQIPVRIVIERDGEDDVTLFRGHIEEPTEEQIAPEGASTWPVSGGRAFLCNAAGKWRELQQALTQTSFSWVEPDTGLPYKITDLVRTLLLSVTDAAHIDVPDLPTRLWASDVRDLMPAGVELLPYLGDLIEGYLGARLIWDDSAGTDGMWRLIAPPQPPYTPVAAFTLQRPNDGLFAGAPEAHDAVVYAAPGGDVTLIPRPIRKGSFWSRTRRLEGNVIVVVGSSGEEDNSAMIQQFAINTKSFLAHTGAPALDPDYPGMIGYAVEVRLVDRGLVGADAVNWTVRRLYNVTAVPRKDYGLVAPSQLVTDPLDTLQERPRCLRDYDPVLLIHADGSQTMCLVTSSQTSGRKAFAMTDQLTLMSVDPVVVGGQFDGVIPPDRDVEKTILRLAARMQGIGLVSSPTEASRGRDYRRSLEGGAAEILDPIQDLDPMSPTYGDWL